MQTYICSIRNYLYPLSPNHDQQHLERLFRHEGMGSFGGHDQHVPRGNDVRFSRQGNLRFSVQDIDDGVKGGGVFAQPLAGIEGK